MLYIFDWDGTVSDSVGKITVCLQKAAKQLQLPIPSDEQAHNIIGLGLPEAIQTLFPMLEPAAMPTFKEAYSAHFLVEDAQPSAFFPGVMETLTHLRDEGAQLAIATGKSRKGLNRVLSNLGMQDFFHHTRCADETASKPNPQMLHELLSATQARADQAVMVGDTEWDMRMADNANMAKIAVSFGAHTVERLQACEPNLLVDRFDAILDWCF